MFGMRPVLLPVSEASELRDDGRCFDENSRPGTFAGDFAPMRYPRPGRAGFFMSPTTCRQGVFRGGDCFPVL